MSDLDPATMEKIKKAIIRQEKADEPRNWMRYLKNVWDALKGNKSVIIIQVVRTQAFPVPRVDLERMEREAGGVLAGMDGQRVPVAEEDDDGLSVFRRAFSMKDDEQV